MLYPALFWVLQALYIEGGNLLIHHQCAASTWMMQRQPYCTRTPTTHTHTPAYWWRGDRVMKPISVWGWLGDHDGQRPIGKYGRHYTGTLGPTQTTGWAPPAGLTNTSSSSNLVFPGGLPSRYWPAQPCLAVNLLSPQNNSTHSH